MNIDDLSMKNLTDNELGNWDPAWSRDGRNIAFVSDMDENLDIYVMDAEGDDLKKLTNDPTVEVSPAWSPDGRKIAFSSNRDRDFQIYVMDPDGSNVEKLTSDRGSALSWSPTQ